MFKYETGILIKMEIRMKNLLKNPKNIFSPVLSIFLFSVFVFAMLSFFSSCELVGLGPALDLSSPTLSITSHADNDTVPGEFTLVGTATDNEEVVSILIEFESQNLCYKVEPGNSWYKKTTASGNQWIKVPDSEGLCEKQGSVWNWSIFVRSSEGNRDGTSYSLSASASDAMKNSGKNSKVDLSLIMDENTPSVSIYKPELFSGSYESVSKETEKYDLQNGTIISNLFNGDITLSGRQDGSISFKELRIEFDNGKLTSGTRKVTGDSETFASVDEISESTSLGDEDGLKIYYSKTLKRGQDGIGDLRNWELSVPASDWVNAEKNAELLSLGTETGAGKLIRVVTTSLSDSLAWEKKVVGWFVWWPEADFPWIDTFSGDDSDNGENTYSVYPSANFSGTAQDDDGIRSLSYSIEKQNENGGWNEYEAKTEIKLSDENAKYSAFSIKTPSENGKYKISLAVTDIYGISATKTKYFKTLDVSPPKINILSPENNTSVLADKDGNITFSGNIGDDGTVKSFSLIWLNPSANNDPNNLIRYMSGNETEWEKATESGSDSGQYSFTENGKTVQYSNKIYKIDLGEKNYNSAEKLNKYDFSRTFNIFSDLKIDGTEKPLSTQYFVFRAVDNGGTKSVLQFSLYGDTETPALEINSIQQFDKSGNKKIDEYSFSESSVPRFAAVQNDDYAVLKGVWSDNSVISWNNDKSKLNADSIVFSWGDADFKIEKETLNEDGSWSWEAKITNLPKTSRTLEATLKDFGGNSKTVTKSIFIETSELGLESIGSLAGDGSYKVGEKIQITLNFTKNTKVDTSRGIPSLTLNNGGKANYVSGGEEGNAGAQHIFEYTVSDSEDENDTKDLNENGTLDVESFNANGAVYTDASVTNGNAFEIELPTESEKRLGSSRSIKIDRTSPKISSVKAISGGGYYNQGKSILFLLSFDENVTISGAEKLGLSFGAFTSSESAGTSGSASSSGSSESSKAPKVEAKESGSNIIFTYTVSDGENTENENPLSISSVTNTAGVTVKDEAGNILSDWTVDSFALENKIYIDTSSPSAPVISKNWGESNLVTSATSFTISGAEDDATLEYSIDGGKNYLICRMNGESRGSSNVSVNLSNNGTYQIKARQTDKAGNVSAVSDGGTVVVEKGDFLNKITATAAPGTYSVNKGGSVIGKLVFRKDISLPDGATVTLNVKNSSSGSGSESESRTVSESGNVICALEKSSSATIAGGSDYEFTYKIKDGDYIESDGETSLPLDVVGWSFTSVSYSTGVSEVGNGGIIDFDLTYDSAVKDANGNTNGKKLSDNRKIYIKTGNPSVQNAVLGGTVETDGTVSSPVLTVTFDREITKVGNNIVLSLSETDGDSYSDKFIAPSVISASDYNSAFDFYYTEGLNGAEKGSDGKLLNDTTTKYVLNFETEPDDSALVSLFAEKGWNKVEIPVVSSAVSVNGKILSIDLSGTYRLPVMGAKYKLTIPEGTVSDEVRNKNQKCVKSVVAVGVESPVIRINKGKQTITPGTSPNFTSGSSVKMPETAKMRIDCQTPNSVIYYGKTESTSAAKFVLNSGEEYDTKTKAPDVPSSFAKYSSELELGTSVSSYGNASGLKIAISAYASKTDSSSGSSEIKSAYAYEYATRTVLKFKIEGGYSNNSDGKAGTTSAIKENGKTLSFGELKVWVVGGDSAYGGNSISPFPLAWHDSSNFKLMKGSFTNTSSSDNSASMNGKWYWLSWDITTATYHGFVIGDVPSDASENGPNQWYTAEGGWDAQKENYVLYPGETLEMQITSNGKYSNGSYHWRTKNHGTR